MKANQNQNVNNNNESNNATATANTEKVVKAIEQKRSDILKDCFKEISVTEIQKSTIERFSAFGEFTAMYRGCDKQENGKFGKSGGKTIYNFETESTIYMGYTSSELAAVFGIEKRAYKSAESKSESDSPYLAELKGLQKAIEKVITDDGKNFVLSFSEQLKAKIEQVTTKEKEKAQFESTFAAVIPLFDIISESQFAEKHGENNLKIALALGYRFSDTKSDTESQESQESNTKESTKESK